MDDFYKKQLESFGIESTRIVPGDLEKRRREERKASSLVAVKTLMSRMEGRQWLYTILDDCRTFASPFVPGQPDTSAFFMGAQAMGFRLLNEILQSSPENYPVMLQEEAARNMVKRDEDNF